ncbi:DDE_3 domain-containing protein [Trichonephila clavipes]|nr:DDE_3 domain-containing protein [Trichonephila clavipes]
MVWACNMLDRRTPLHIFEKGSVIRVRYGDEVLEPYVRVFSVACGSEFILMDDNAKPHRALLVDEFLENRACLGRSGEGNCNSEPPSENHPENENSVAERVGPCHTRTDKLPCFKYDIPLRGM